METFRTDSPDATVRLGRRLAERFDRGDCVAMVGDLGAGKTVLVRGIVGGLGGDEALVSSPTYVLVQEYPGRVPVYHVDLYRLPPDEADLDALGIDEMLADGVVLIEWADRAAGRLPRPHWRIDIAPAGADARSLRLARVD